MVGVSRCIQSSWRYATARKDAKQEPFQSPLWSPNRCSAVLGIRCLLSSLLLGGGLLQFNTLGTVSSLFVPGLVALGGLEALVTCLQSRWMDETEQHTSDKSEASAHSS